MSEHQDHHHGLPDDEHAHLPYHLARPTVDGPHESVAHRLAPTLDDFHGFLSPFEPLSGPYGHLDNAGTLVNYQPAFQPTDYTPQQHLYAFAGDYNPSIHMPTGFYNSQTIEQPWVEEIHPSHTSINVSTFGWTPPDSNSYGWLVNTPFTNPGEQLGNENAVTMLPVHQYSPLDNPASDPFYAYFVPETTPRIPQQRTEAMQPASIAIKVRNENLKKDITTLPYEKSDHTEHRPLRVSKTKRAEKGNNNIKHEACWRCKRYRKAVSSYSHREYTCTNRSSVSAEMSAKSVQLLAFEFGHQPSAVGGEQWRALLRKLCPVS